MFSSDILGAHETVKTFREIGKTGGLFSCKEKGRRERCSNRAELWLTMSQTGDRDLQAAAAAATQAVAEEEEDKGEELKEGEDEEEDDDESLDAFKCTICWYVSLRESERERRRERERESLFKSKTSL
jgi:hypothetical protein